MDLSKAIRERLAALEPQSLDLLDESERHAGHPGAAAGGSHFSLTIVSLRFAGHDTLARHRMIYAALGPLMHREIHALAIRAFAPDEL
jgi:BolA protein